MRRAKEVTGRYQLKHVDFKLEPTLEFLHKKTIEVVVTFVWIDERRPEQTTWETRIMKNKKRSRSTQTWYETIAGILDLRG